MATTVACVAYCISPLSVEPLYFAANAPHLMGSNEDPLPFAVPDADEAFFKIAELDMTSLGRASQIDMKLASIASIKRLAEKGQACTLGPCSAFSTELAGGDWSFEKVETPLPYRDIVWRSDERDSELIGQARDTLQAVIQRCAEDGPAGTVVVLSE